MISREMIAILVLSIMLLISTSAYSLEKPKAFPQELVGVWVYETGDGKLDGCNTPRVMVNKIAISIVQECIDEGRSVSRYRVKDVLVDRAFFSGKIQEYHLLTDGPSVVFDLLGEYSRSSIYLQFWVTDDYGPTRQLGVFNLKM